MDKLKSPKVYLKWTGLSLLSGILSGLAATLFLISLDWVTQFRITHSFLIWGLPLGGLLIGWIYFRYAGVSARGHNLILEEIHQPQSTLPLRMAPLVFVGTLVTHLFGGSAGREGTAVQMGATLSDQLSRIFKIEAEERKILLSTGIGAGFSAALGAPWAGIIFGMEVIHRGRLRLFAFFEGCVASYSAYFITLILKAPHTHYPQIQISDYQIKTFFWIALAGVIFGLTARGFSQLTHGVERLCARWISYPPLRPFFAGVILVILYAMEGSYRFPGLGISEIQRALETESSWQMPFLKTFFTALTVGSGFKGGEFIPLVFIGTTLGSALSALIPVSLSILAALGFCAVFAGAAKTPLACTLMAIEIFGYQIGPWAAVVCFMSYFCSGPQGIYKSQKMPEYKIKS